MSTRRYRPLPLARWTASLAAAAALLPAGQALAAGFTELGQEVEAAPETTLLLNGDLRLRSEVLGNFDLDRGPTPAGRPLFPVPLADPTAQLLTHAEARLRLDVAAIVPAAFMSLKLRVDVLDNLALGSSPDGPPYSTLSQNPPAVAMRVRRAYGQVVLPFGVLSAGRSAGQWGLGMLTNGGDCPDCDSGDSADRIALITPLAGHLWAVAYDFSNTGPYTTRRNAQRALDLDPSDDVRSITAAVMRWRSPLSLARRSAAGRVTIDYGAYLSYRRQGNDIPAAYLPLAVDVTLDPSQVMRRDLWATAVDGWLRIVGDGFRIELEGALLLSEIGQDSLVPGVIMEQGITARQWGCALETDFGPRWLTFGLDAGAASGDAAYGFGAYPYQNQPAARAGDLDGPQAILPYDTTVNNFRFHPDYRIDRILFREIIGTVTDAVYVRPHLRWEIARLGPDSLSLSAAAVATWALQPTSTPGGQRPLGVELDPTLEYGATTGFGAALEYAVLFPLEGLDNPDRNLDAQPAQLIRLRLRYAF